MKKNIIIILSVLFVISLAGNLSLFNYFQGDKNAELENKPRGIMMLIEYKDTDGLVNFVNELNSRGIYSLLSASPDFIEENCDVIKTLLDYKMDIVSQNPEGSFWDVSYEEQYQAIKNAKDKIEACTGEPLKVISSRYFASDENTVKAAEQLGIPYVLARGTAGTEAIVFKPEEYNVRIISVSNIPSIEFEYGSLCDYSYWVREGTPEDMRKQLVESLGNNKITPVSHTNIGGFKKQWNDMWLNFFDEIDIEWQSLDDFASADIILPMWRIPSNKNTPYTPQQRPLIPYEEEEDVNNPCRIGEISLSTQGNKEEKLGIGNKIIMFHNGKGPMCLEAVDFLDDLDYSVEQLLDNEEGFQQKLDDIKGSFSESEGVSTSFGYFPIIFIKDKAYSGFNDEIKNKILYNILTE